ncbi:MAG: helix-hairpin-helix domain-containing protein, partial [Deltaproteobacteria bacterium]|nr:helix-hairpin-helix domain-containing protein [Deltaproteobacteria bacterium]
VGVEVNTASAPLLARVAGIGPSLAKKIVAHRDKRGSFRARKELLEVSGLGPKAFEQAAGFLRIRGAAHPLDASAVHPERYELVERIARDAGVKVAAMIGDEAITAKIDWSKYESAEVGKPTLDDIRRELARPGRDPRASFEAPSFRDDVRTLDDVKEGMTLEGVVTNVTAFGAFVDIGVHQDGLVHVSQLSDRFVKDPHAVARVGDRMKVRVLSVDRARKRISLTAKKS